MNFLEKTHVLLDYIFLYIPGRAASALFKLLGCVISRAGMGGSGMGVIEWYRAQLWSNRLGIAPIRTVIVSCAVVAAILLAGTFLIVDANVGLLSVIVFILVIAITVVIILYVIASIGPYPGTDLNLRSDRKGVRSIHMGFWATLCTNYCARMPKTKIFTDSFVILDHAVSSGYKGEVLLVSHLLHNHVQAMAIKIARRYPKATVQGMSPEELPPLSGLYVLGVMIKLRNRLEKKKTKVELPEAMAGIRIIF